MIKQIVQKRDSILTHQIDEETVILNLGTEHYFVLNPVGTRMWQVLTTSGSVEEASASLIAEYDVDAATLRNDLNEFVQQLKDAQIIDLLVVDD